MGLKELNKTRGSIKFKLTSFKKYLEPILESKELTKLQVVELNARLVKLQDLYNDFDQTQTEIENLSEIPGDEYIERETFETGYFGAIAAAQELLGRSSPQADASSAMHDCEASVTGSISHGHSHVSNIRLPTINLPTFSGRYQDWLGFHDAFVSLIHSNTSIPKIQKFHYLRASLKDAAAEVIQSIELSADNYDIAWQTLCELYHDSKLLINNHIEALFNIETLVRESSKSLRKIIATININLRALNSLKLPTEHWDVLIIHMVSNKLDPVTSREWESQINKMKEMPKLIDFTEFLRGRANLSEAMEIKKRRHSETTHVRPKTFITLPKAFACPVCKDQHSIYNCTKFKSMPIEARLEKVKQLKLCKNCLRQGHAEGNCKLGPCKLCSQRHNSMIHTSFTKSKPTQSETLPSKSSECVVLPALEEQQETESQQNITLSSTHQSQVLLSTAIVNITDCNGQSHKVRALLDNGSTSSFITEKLEKQLHIPSYSTSISVQGLNKQSSKITKRCDVTISSLYQAADVCGVTSSYTADVNCFVVPQITQFIPTTRIYCETINIPPHIHLADPTFSVPSEVQMLLGADLFWEVLTNNRITLGKNKPTLVETKLGWLVSGSIKYTNNNNHTYNTVHCHLINNIELEEKLNKFFELESTPVTQQVRTKGESDCEAIFKETTFRQPDGRFVVTIPLKETPECLGDSMQQALTRFHSLERKFKRNSIFAEKYTGFMTEYESLGHMSQNTHTQPHEISNFLPHHGVLREDSLTTKLRTVFDASAVTSSGKSFNDIQHIGPTVQDDLLSILIRFRQHKIVVTSDIEKMYRQILINENQRSLQQILWRSDPNHEIKIYKLNTITYGTASAPYLATRCIMQLGLECTDESVSETILHDFYVDDLITGHEDEFTLLETCKGVIEQLEGAHFHLRKWRSNSTSLLTKLVGENSNDEMLTLNKHDNVKTLGLIWASKKDTLLFSPTIKSHSDIQTQKNNKINKRTILSTIAQIFDPLGLINPCMLQAKLILQALWAKNISWDDQLPSEIEYQWQSFIQHLPELATIEIPRRVLGDFPTKIELHAFSDASIKAYSACIYLRSVSNDGKVTVHLLLAKGRVAPLKQKITMPRLELCGALLATQLAKKVTSSLRVKIDSHFFWCDSTIVLGWIKTCKQQNLKQFVYNRIKEIKNNSETSSWNYVPTDLNPADIGSRGLNAMSLKNSTLWWGGPHFLHETDIHWPIQPQNTNIENLPEIKFQCNFSSSEPHETDLARRFSNYGKLQRVIVYMKRFVHNCRNPTNKIIGHPTILELDSATKTLCKVVQMDMFCKQHTLLTNKRSLPPKDKLLSLTPFVDSADLIRVGGRLANSNYDYDTKHPILLHASHNITKLLVEHYHKILLHAGPQLLLSNLRHKFWIINGRNLTRKVTRQCLTCCRFSGKTYQPIMGNLPEQRLHAEYPFINTAVDYAGPILIADRKGRGCKTKKAYICIFVCLAVRAVHVELVTELTTQAFLAALNRFVARRGRPALIYSDNGTNFIGASNELSKFLKASSNDITSQSAKSDIKFKFSPAYSPHFNGLAEGSVKSVKFHLKRVLAMANLDYEEMNSVLVQIEGMLNSRPLTPLSSDPSDLIPITPAHFLIGRTITMLPSAQVSVEEVQIRTLPRLQRVEALKGHFWKRYYKEYLSELQRRTKWRDRGQQPQTGEMILIKEDRLPPNKWLLGRIAAVYPGTDGVNRVADITTSSGTLRRAFNRLVPLPMLEQPCSKGGSMSTHTPAASGAGAGAAGRGPTPTDIRSHTAKRD